MNDYVVKYFEKDHYRYIKKIGEGGVGSVYLFENTTYHQYFAIKLMPEDNKNFETEVQSMLKLAHPNIVNIYKYSNVLFYNYIIMDYCRGGTLIEKIKREGPVPQDQAIVIASKIINAIFYCHSAGITHRDIKPSNIFLDEAGNPKLGDFGFSKHYEEGEKEHKKCGSVPYFSPEMLNQKLSSYDPFKADVWALGITLFYMVTGRLPYESITKSDLIHEILKKPINFAPIEASPLSEIIKMMLTPDPESRPSIAVIYSQPICKIKSRRKFQRSSFGSLLIKNKNTQSNPNHALSLRTAYSVNRSLPKFLP